MVDILRIAEGKKKEEERRNHRSEIIRPAYYYVWAAITRKAVVGISRRQMYAVMLLQLQFNRDYQ